MAQKRKKNTTKNEIIHVATRMFLEKGYSNTSIKCISNELDISTGNLTFHFSTKEDLLAVLVELLCEFQWKMMKQTMSEGKTSLLAVCFEMAVMAAICEESEIVKDFYIAAYTHPKSLAIIRKSDTERAKFVFGKYQPEWEDVHFEEAEILVSGIEYATLMKTDEALSLDVRIAGAMNAIMMIYGVPEEKRREKIEKVLQTDYRTVGRNVFSEFTQWTEQACDFSYEI